MTNAPVDDRSEPAAPSIKRADAGGYVALAIGVLSVGAAAILIREAAAPALAVSFLRTLIGGAVLFVVVRARSIPLPSGDVLRRALIAGVLLGVHFWTWIASLSLTSVAASVVLVCTQPIFVAILSRLLLGERTSLRGALGIVIAFAGAALIALDGAHTAAGSSATSLANLEGDALALAGAIAIALYVLVGRNVGGKVDVRAYSATVSLAAAAFLSVPFAVSIALHGVDASAPSSTSSWLWIVALALGPQLIGHTALNAALQRLPAAVVSGSILGEPVIATALAAAFLGEVPGVFTIAGSAVVLIGLALLLSAPAARPRGP